MVTVSKTTIFSNSFKAIRDILIDNITDPKNRFKKSLIRSYRQFPSAEDFCGYPYVVVNAPSASSSTPNNCGNRKDIEWNVIIEVISDDTSNLDALSDAVFSILNSTTHQETLRTSGFKIVNLTANGGVRDFIEGKEVFVRSFTLNLKSPQMVVS